jgi:hypothetical protein
MGKPQGERNDGERGRRGACGREDRAAGDEEVGDAVNLAVGVDHATARILMHAGRTDLIPAAFEIGRPALDLGGSQGASRPIPRRPSSLSMISSARSMVRQSGRVSSPVRHLLGRNTMSRWSMVRGAASLGRGRQEHRDGAIIAKHALGIFATVEREGASVAAEPARNIPGALVVQPSVVRPTDPFASIEAHETGSTGRGSRGRGQEAPPSPAGLFFAQSERDDEPTGDHRGRSANVKPDGISGVHHAE